MTLTSKAFSVVLLAAMLAASCSATRQLKQSCELTEGDCAISKLECGIEYTARVTEDTAETSKNCNTNAYCVTDGITTTVLSGSDCAINCADKVESGEIDSFAVSEWNRVGATGSGFGVCICFTNGVGDALIESTILGAEVVIPCNA